MTMEPQFTPMASPSAVSPLEDLEEAAHRRFPLRPPGQSDLEEFVAGHLKAQANLQTFLFGDPSTIIGLASLILAGWAIVETRVARRDANNAALNTARAGTKFCEHVCNAPASGFNKRGQLVCEKGHPFPP